jgi:hypothetical protein
LSASGSFLPADLDEERVSAPDDFVFELEHVAERGRMPGGAWSQ